jgi:uncharacterized membrane protein YczE
MANQHALSAAAGSTRRIPWVRLGRLAAGTLAMGAGIALLVGSRLGMVPMDTLHLALAHAVGWSFGGGIIACQAILLITFVPLRIRPGIGTVAGLIVPALTADILLALLPPPTSLAWRLVTLVGGGVLFCTGVGIYLLAALGPLPRDGLMLALAGDRDATGSRGRRLSLVRIGIDLVFVATATVILGPAEAVHTGVVGAGTVVLILFSGPMIVLALRNLPRIPGFSSPGTPGRHRAPSRRAIAGFRTEPS